MAIDVTDATFQTDVLERSLTTPVVVDLWAPWCGPCRTLGPILEKVTDATDGAVVLVKVNVDDNPNVSQAFRVQGIPAVYAVKDGQIVDGFVGAYPEHAVQEFVDKLLPTVEETQLTQLVAESSEGSLRAALGIDPGHEDAVVGLADLLVARGEPGDVEEALALLERIPESERTRKVAAKARIADQPADDYDATLSSLLATVKLDDEARQRYVDILELMGPDDPRTSSYRRKLTAALY